MKKKIFFVLISLFGFFGLLGIAFAQTDDPNARDTVKVSSAVADTIGEQVVLTVSFFADENFGVVSCPFKYSGVSLMPESVSFKGSLLESAPFLVKEIDTTAHEIVAAAVTLGMPPSAGLFCKLFFRVKDTAVRETVVVDTFSRFEPGKLQLTITDDVGILEWVPEYTPGKVFIDLPPPPVNYNPELILPNDQSVYVGQTLVFNVTATDPNPNDTLNVTKSGVGNFSFTPRKSPATGSFSWTPQPADTLNSPYSVIFTATDGQGGSDTDTVVITVRTLTIPPSGMDGDLTGDNQVSIGDLIFLLNFLYKGGPPPNPPAAGDVNEDCFVTVGDLVYFINYFYKHGPPPLHHCLPGDANYDGYVNVPDLIYFINWAFRFGPAPISLKSCDVNNDCVLDIVDLVYLINFMFRAGPIPEPGCNFDALAGSGLKTTSGMPLEADLELGGFNISKENTVSVPIAVKTGTPLAALLLKLEFDNSILEPLAPISESVIEKMELSSYVKENQQVIGVFDLKGENYVPAGENILLTLRFKKLREGNIESAIKILRIELASPEAQDLPVNLKKVNLKP